MVDGGQQAAGRGGARSVTVQYLALAATWGASFLFIKVALEGVSPGQVVLGRLVAGTVALAVVCVVTRQRLPRDPVVWGHLSVVALLMCVVPFSLFAWAEQHVSSGVASILNATTPLMTMGVSLAALPAERPTRARLAGLLTGLGGVALVLAPWTAAGTGAGAAGGGARAGQVACLLATFCYGVSFVYLRRTIAPRRLAAVPVATVQVGLAAALVLALAPVVAAQPVQLDGRVVAAVLALGVLGTGFAYVWNTNVVTGWGATNASTVTYLTPLVGVAAGAAVLGEHVTWNQPVGAVVVVSGVVVAQERVPAVLAAAGRLSGLRRGPGRRARGRRPAPGRRSAPTPVPAPRRPPRR